MKMGCNSGYKMSSSFAFVALLLSLLTVAVYCDNDHHSHHRDDQWITFVSKIESFWKTDTFTVPSETHSKSSLSNSKDQYTSEGTMEAENSNQYPKPTILHGYRNYDDVVIEDKDFNGDYFVRAQDAASTALLITGIFFGVCFGLSCCCFLIFGCCCGKAFSRVQPGFVVNSNADIHVPPPQPPAVVVVQQPMHHDLPPAYQEKAQLPSAPSAYPQQFPSAQSAYPQQFQPLQHYSPAGIENPTYQHTS